jgi:hypothetical protein
MTIQLALAAVFIGVCFGVSIGLILLYAMKH